MCHQAQSQCSQIQNIERGLPKQEGPDQPTPQPRRRRRPEQDIRHRPAHLAPINKLGKSFPRRVKWPNRVLDLVERGLIVLSLFIGMAGRCRTDSAGGGWAAASVCGAAGHRGAMTAIRRGLRHEATTPPDACGTMDHDPGGVEALARRVDWHLFRVRSFPRRPPGVSLRFNPRLMAAKPPAWGPAIGVAGAGGGWLGVAWSNPRIAGVQSVTKK